MSVVLRKAIVNISSFTNIITINGLTVKDVEIVHSSGNKKTATILKLRFLMWCLQESNQGHMDFQSIALPTELRHHAVKRLQI